MEIFKDLSSYTSCVLTQRQAGNKWESRGQATRKRGKQGFRYDVTAKRFKFFIAKTGVVGRDLNPKISFLFSDVVSSCRCVRQVLNAFFLTLKMASITCIGLLIHVHFAFSALVFEKSTVEIPPDPNLKEWIADYPFKNTGNQPVTIQDIRTCCECTSAKLEKKIYAPGESGKVTLVFKTVGKTGIQEKHAVITTDGKPEPDIIFLKGKIPTAYDYIAISPSTLRWEANEPRKPKRVMLRTTQEKNIKFLKALSSNKNFKTTLQTDSTGASFLEVVPPLGKKREVSRIFVQTDYVNQNSAVEIHVGAF